MRMTHKIKGKVTQSFILRGALFQIGTDINLKVAESEISFIETRIESAEIEPIENMKSSKKEKTHFKSEEVKVKQEQTAIESHEVEPKSEEVKVVGLTPTKPQTVARKANKGE